MQERLRQGGRDGGALEGQAEGIRPVAVVIDDHPGPPFGHRTDQPFPKAKALLVLPVAEPVPCAGHQQLGLFIPQEDRPCARPDQLRGSSHDQGKQRLEVQLARDLFADGAHRLELRRPCTERVLRQPSLGHIPDQTVVGKHAPLCIPMQDGGVPHPSLGPILARDPVLERRGILARLDPARLRAHGIAVGLIHHTNPQLRIGGKLCAGVTRHRHTARPVPRLHRSARLHAHRVDVVAHGGGDAPIPLLALPKRRFRAAPLGQLPPRRLVQPGVLDGDGRLAREHRQKRDLRFRVDPGLRIAEGEHAQDLVPAHDRKAEIGDVTVLRREVRSPEMRVGADIRNRQRRAVQGDPSGDTLADLHDQPVHLFSRHADAHAATKRLPLFVQHVQPRVASAGDGRGLVDDGAEALLEVQRRGDGFVGPEQGREFPLMPLEPARALSQRGDLGEEFGGGGRSHGVVSRDGRLGWLDLARNSVGGVPDVASDARTTRRASNALASLRQSRGEVCALSSRAAGRTERPHHAASGSERPGNQRPRGTGRVSLVKGEGEAEAVGERPGDHGDEGHFQAADPPGASRHEALRDPNPEMGQDAETGCPEHRWASPA